MIKEKQKFSSTPQFFGILSLFHGYFHDQTPNKSKIFKLNDFDFNIILQQAFRIGVIGNKMNLELVLSNFEGYLLYEKAPEKIS